MATRRTLLHLIDTGGPGGAETIFLNLVSRLDPQQFCSVAAVPERGWLWQTLEEHNIEPVLLPTDSAFDLSYLRGITALVRRHQIDLIQTHLFTSAVYASVAAIPRGLHVVSTFHGHNDLESSARYRSAKYRLITRRRNRYVFVSETLRNWFLRKTPLGAARARVIYNGIDCEQFKPARDQKVRAEFGVQPDEWFVGAVGNLRAPKDYPAFLRAAAILGDRSPRYKFVIAGAHDERIRGELEHLRSELRLEGRLHFAGFRHDAERVINALDVYALTSISEGFSLTTAQAMACGIPVVATRSGGPEEIIINEVTGLLVGGGGYAIEHELAAAIERLCLSKPLRCAFGRAGREHVLRNFSIDSMVNAYAALYEQCLMTSTATHMPDRV